MSFDTEKIYELLPAFYRTRDAEQGEPLKALLSVIADQVAVHEEDLAQLYDDQFIETCAEWVVPYIGDLVGARQLTSHPGASFSNRAQVANTLAYRRRKGTAAVLEQVARDVTGWNASVAEFFQLLATTQYMNHLRRENRATPDLRRMDSLEGARTPFDTLAHTADVRGIERRRGKYNIPNVAIFLWRTNAFSLTNAAAYKVDARRYRFNPLGFDTELYNRPETESEITHLAESANVPAPLMRRTLDKHKKFYYGDDRSLSLIVNGEQVAASEVVACDLSDAIEDGSAWAHAPSDKYAIDPVLGRFVLPETGETATEVRVNSHYGFTAEIGGGEYGRAATFTADLKTVIEVPGDEATIQDALGALELQGDDGGAIELENNDYFIETPTINLAAGAALELRAADERRPIIVSTGDLIIGGGEDAEVTLNGLVIVGGRIVIPAEIDGATNELRVLRLRHCTLVPRARQSIGDLPAEAESVPRLVIEAANVRVEIEHCITGGIRAVDAAHVRIANSILDAESETAVAYSAPDDAGAGAPLTIENTTVIGKLHALTLHASNTIFLARLTGEDAWVSPVRAARLQEGCVRFSYVSLDARVPRRFHCQPHETDGKQQAARVRPVFTSRRYGDARYCQLDSRTAKEIKQGADDEAEMGAFHDLYQPQRIANLRVRLDEYLRFGLEAGIFEAS